MGVLLVIKNEFIRSFRYKKKFVLTLIIPILSVILAMGVNSIMKPTINIGIINNESIEIVEKIITDSSNIKGLKVKNASQESINTDLISAKYMAIIKFEDNDLEVISLDNNIKNQVQEAVDNYLNTASLALFADMLTQMENESLSAGQRGVGFVLLTLIVTSTISTCNILKDKAEGVVKRFKLSKFKPRSYILGVYLFNILLTVSQILISTVIMKLFNISIGISSIQFLFIGILIAIVSSTIASIIVSLTNTELQASLLASAFAMIISLFGGAFIQIEKMPNLIQYLSNLSITKWIGELTLGLEKGILSFNNIFPLIISCGILSIILLVSIKIGEKSYIND